tara:strand:- start:3459 stop:3842 length:384 start_codon:yes stop_codon:yes gene_type:complete
METTMPTRSNPYEWIEAEMLGRIIGPKIQETIRRREPSSVAEMIRHMETDYKMAGVTAARMKEWLDKLGYEVKQRVVFEIPGSAADDLVQPQEDHDGGSFKIIEQNTETYNYASRPVSDAGGIQGTL